MTGSCHAGSPVPSLVFFHIPLPEYGEVWEQGDCLGQKGEDVCAPKLNTGLFAALWETGESPGVFVGHDHLNDYVGVLHGVPLCYGRVSGYNTYPRDATPRGARVIRLREGTNGFKTWLRLDDGTVRCVWEETPGRN